MNSLAGGALRIQGVAHGPWRKTLSAQWRYVRYSVLYFIAEKLFEKHLNAEIDNRKDLVIGYLLDVLFCFFCPIFSLALAGFHVNKDSKQRLIGEVR